MSDEFWQTHPYLCEAFNTLADLCSRTQDGNSCDVLMSFWITFSQNKKGLSTNQKTQKKKCSSHSHEEITISLIFWKTQKRCCAGFIQSFLSNDNKLVSVEYFRKIYLLYLCREYFKRVDTYRSFLNFPSVW